MNYEEYRKQVLGKSIDVDYYPKYQRFQCVDIPNDYLAKLGYKHIICSATGFAGDIWTQRKTNGVLDFCTEHKEAKVGDIAVFIKSDKTPFTHVGLVDKVYSNGTVDILGQNQDQPYVTIVNFSGQIIYGYLRPKCFQTTPKKKTETDLNVKKLNKLPTQFKSKKGTFKVTSKVPILVRKAPNTKKGQKSGFEYRKGQSVSFIGYVVNEGYVWIAWKSMNTGDYHYMAIGKGTSITKLKEKYGEVK